MNWTMGGITNEIVRDTQPLIKNQPTAARDKHIVLPSEPKSFQELPSFSSGLEFLTELDHLFVKQTVKMCEVLTGGWCLAANEYTVTTSAGQDLLKVEEKSDSACDRQLSGSRRSFDIEIMDNSGKEVLHLSRPEVPFYNIIDPYVNTNVINPVSGEVFGHVSIKSAIYFKSVHNYSRNQFSDIDPQAIKVCDAYGVLQFEIQLRSRCGCFGEDIFFDITNTENTEIGVITKQWGGCCKTMLTNAANFEIRFLNELDPKMKAMLLGAVFSMDFTYYTKSLGLRARLWSCLECVKCCVGPQLARNFY